MPYAPPTRIDLAEVYALNAAFLALMKQRPIREGIAESLDAELQKRLADLTDAEADCLARAPFLLFSLKESDDGYWDRVHSVPVTYDLFGAAPEAALRHLTDAALAYVWQLARQNPYALRLICCASLHWCERLAEQCLVDVLGRAGQAKDLLSVRAAEQTDLWQRLVDGGVDSREAVRQSTHCSVLQVLLIQPHATRREWRQAACRSRVPALRLPRQR